MVAALWSELAATYLDPSRFDSKSNNDIIRNKWRRATDLHRTPSSGAYRLANVPSTLASLLSSGRPMRSRTSLARLEVRRPSIGRSINGAPGRIRTYTSLILSQLTLPVGLLEHGVS